jgi:hypothetical protein
MVYTKNIARRSVLSAIRSLTYKMHRATDAVRSFGLHRQALPVGPTPVVRQIIIVIIPRETQPVGHSFSIIAYFEDGLKILLFRLAIYRSLAVISELITSQRGMLALGSSLTC